jgi:hypothetical protein
MKNPPACFLNGWDNFGAVGELTAVEKGTRAWAVSLEVGTGLYILGQANQLANFDVDVIDIVSGRDTLAVSCDLDAILGREGPDKYCLGKSWKRGTSRLLWAYCDFKTNSPASYCLQSQRTTDPTGQV